MKEKRGGGVQPANTFCSATGSSVDSKVISPSKKAPVAFEAPPTAPNPAKNTRSKAREAPNPAKNTRSKKLKF